MAAQIKHQSEKLGISDQSLISEIISSLNVEFHQFIEILEFLENTRINDSNTLAIFDMLVRIKPVARITCEELGISRTALKRLKPHHRKVFVETAIEKIKLHLAELERNKPTKCAI